MDPDTLKKVFIKGLATNMKINNYGSKETCEMCIEGKAVRKSFQKHSNKKAKEILDMIYVCMRACAKYNRSMYSH